MDVPLVLLPAWYTQLARGAALGSGHPAWSVAFLCLFNRPSALSPSRNRPALQAWRGTRSSAQAATRPDPLLAPAPQASEASAPSTVAARPTRGSGSGVPCLLARPLPSPYPSELRSPRPFRPRILGLVSAHRPALTVHPSLNPLLFPLHLAALIWTPALKYILITFIFPLKMTILGGIYMYFYIYLHFSHTGKLR